MSPHEGVSTWRGGAASPSLLALLVTVERRGQCERCQTLRLTGPMMPCGVCGEPAEPSAVGTPTCSTVCLGQLADAVLPRIAEELKAHPLPGAQPTPAPKPKLRPVGTSTSVETALEHLGGVSDVLERHAVRTRSRSAFCPLHPNERTPAMSVYERGGKSRAHCFGCDFDGDALDLEAALAGEDVATTIRRWAS